MSKYIVFFALVVFLGLPVGTDARTPAIVSDWDLALTEEQRELEEVATAFQSIITWESTVTIPTVVDIKLPAIYDSNDQFMVVDVNGSMEVGEATYFNTELGDEIEVVISEQSGVGTGNIQTLYDSNLDSYVDFPLSESGSGKVSFVLHADEMVSASALEYVQPRNAIRPTHVSVAAMNPSSPGDDDITGPTTLLSKKRVTGDVVKFLEYSTKTWVVTFDYTQPLRLSELKLIQDAEVERQGLRFLAQPDTTYTILLNPDRRVSFPVKESANLRSDNTILNLDLNDLAITTNLVYEPADIDKDGVDDVDDNCPTVANPDQTDIDKNSVGDACEDFDRDGVMNDKDNCINEPNRYQEDEDGDGIGDVCDTEESRFTERNKWVPWAGMGIAAVVLVLLFALVLKKRPEEEVFDGEVVTKRDETPGSEQG